MRTSWMVWIGIACTGFLVPGATAGQFGYTFDCDGATVNAAGQPFEILVSRHQVPNTADVLYFVQVTLPATDTVVEEELFLAVDNFIPWSPEEKVFNTNFEADTSTTRIEFHMDGVQTGKSVSGHGTFVVDGRAYTFVAWPKTSLT